MPELNIAKQNIIVNGSKNSFESFISNKFSKYFTNFIFFRLSGLVKTDMKGSKDAIDNASHNALIVNVKVKHIN